MDTIACAMCHVPGIGISFHTCKSFLLDMMIFVSRVDILKTLSKLKMGRGAGV